MNLNLAYRNNINKSNNLFDLSICNKLIKLNKKQFIDKGMQGEVYKVHSDKCGSIVVKKKIIKKENLKKWPNDVEWSKKQLEKEYILMKKASQLISKFICPNFILVYGYNYSVPLITMEYADGNSEFLFKSNNYIEKGIYKTFMFQILIAIYSYNKYIGEYHNDIKLANILYKKINPNIIFHYKIRGKNYYVKTHGYLFMLGDFGRSSKKPREDLGEIQLLNFSIVSTFTNTLFPIYKDTLNFPSETTKIFMDFIENKIFLYTHLFTHINFIVENLKLLKSKLDNKSMNKYVLKIPQILGHTNDPLLIITKYLEKYTKEKTITNNIVEHFILE